MQTANVFERYGLTGELIFENALQRLVEGDSTIEQAPEYIMDFARGHWQLVVDENLESLANELAVLNSAVRKVPKEMSDDEIRRTLADSDDFVTANDADFTLSDVSEPLVDGLILVPHGIDSIVLARTIERVLMAWRKTHKASPVQARIRKDDLKA